MDNFENDDILQIHFWNKVRDCIGYEHSDNLTAVIKRAGAKSILQVECRASQRPVYVNGKRAGQGKDEGLFFVRSGPKTEMLDTQRAVPYIYDHF